MPKEYRTIQEVAGPLMLVHGVEGVTYDELGEIELASGETRRCKVLEVNGSDVLVQLFENGLNRLCVVRIGGACLTDWDAPSTTGRRFCPKRAWTSTVCP